MKKLITRRYSIECETIPEAFDGCRLLFLTDLHGCVLPFLEERILAEKPDYILIGGDMLVGSLDPEQQEQTGMEQAEALISRLVRNYPVFYAYGNHEGKTWAEAMQGYRERLTTQGV